MEQQTLPEIPEVKRRGRPAKYANAAERVAACRARKNTRTLSVQVPADLYKALEDYMQFKDLTKNEVIEKLLKTQLLRKR